jgi:hypothetical protein
VISLAALAPRVYLGITQQVDFDGYWHVFIAGQDRWKIFWREYQINPHPLLSYLLLRLSLWFGRSALVFRAVPILSGVGSIFITGKITEKLSLWPYTPAIAALAYGFALPSILLSIEVRGYMLCVCFMLASFYYFLAILDGHSHWKSRILFAVFAMLSISSHYFALFYVLACGLVAAAFDLPSWRKKSLKRVVLDLATFLPVAAFGGLSYYGHGQRRAVVQNHLIDFYFQPGRGEPLNAFLFRNAQYLFNLFSPVEVKTPAYFVIVLVGLALSAAFAVYLIRRPLLENTRAAAMALTSALILGGIIVGGITGRYPFGGFLRHQFILFPFAVMFGCVLLDRSAKAISNRRLKTALLLTVVLAVIAASAAQFYRFPRVATVMCTDEMNRFSEVFPSPSTVYLDDFSLYIFFAHHLDWNWHFLVSNAAVPTTDIYRVSKGTQQVLVVWDRSRWSVDLRDSAFYRDLAAVMRAQELRSIETFTIHDRSVPTMAESNSAIESRIKGLATAAGLCVNKPGFVTTDNAYVEFTDGPCGSNPQSPQPSVERTAETPPSTGGKNATITADPNPIVVCDGSSVGVTKLTWTSTGATTVEVHVNSPSGDLLARGGPNGTATTGKWVTYKTVFYLQDVSDGKSLTRDNTLATLAAKLTSAGCQ